MTSFPKLNMDNSLDKLLPDWPSGPLDHYRQRASFNWKEMKLSLEGEDIIKFKMNVWKTLENDPLFAHNPWDELSRDDERRLTLMRMKRLIEYEFLTENQFIGNPNLAPAIGQCVGQYSWSVCAKKFLSYEYFIANARSGGSAGQNKFMKDIKSFKALGCISITEMAHGSNTKALKTTATFDPKTQEFLLNTPDLEATKVWSGVLGQNATHAAVFAQLYTHDGQCHGLHSFLVPVRNPDTLLPYPGCFIGDMGPKIGLNGIDNGFMQFNNYRVSKDSLMSRNADVSPDGKYITTVKDKSKRFGITLGILSAGRVSIILQGFTNLQTAITISVRYSAVRKQFGPTSDCEIPVIEYQTQQWRLIPYIAAAYTIANFYNTFFKDYINFFISVAYGGGSPDQPEMGSEIHCISSAGKAMVGWIARDAIQESREACGGHGYMNASRFGELRNDHDANNTYEGDNNVLLQQSSNYIMKLFKEKVEERKPIKSYFGSIDYLDNYEAILRSKMNPNINDVKSIIEAYHFLICWLTNQSYIKLENQNKRFNGDAFTARGQTQVYYLRNLSIAYFECDVITRFYEYCNDPTIIDRNRQVLTKLGLLYAQWAIDKHLTSLFEANYFSELRNPATTIRENILHLCESLKDDAVSLVDVFAPPDFILNSSLGHSDGRIYEHIYKAFIENQGALERPDWYTEFTENKPVLKSSDENIFRAKL